MFAKQMFGQLRTSLRQVRMMTFGCSVSGDLNRTERQQLEHRISLTQFLDKWGGGVERARF